ncbi:MAG: hypothetical protein IGR76_13975 [Synechococcales cyanobacterium T60_A2020_003]|nr:hypothetical protein [Synechococcales cyanobacterium T60_A2020_003]
MASSADETLPITLEPDPNGAIVPTPLLAASALLPETETDASEPIPPLVSQQASDLLPSPGIRDFDHQTLNLIAQGELPEQELEQERILEDDSVPAGNGEVIREIQVRYVDRDGQPTEGKTRNFIITRELDLQVGDVYDPDKAWLSLTRIVDLDAVQNASIELEPTATPDEVVMVVNVREA